MSWLKKRDKNEHQYDPYSGAKPVMAPVPVTYADKADSTAGLKRGEDAKKAHAPLYAPADNRIEIEKLKRRRDIGGSLGVAGWIGSFAASMLANELLKPSGPAAEVISMVQYSGFTMIFIIPVIVKSHYNRKIAKLGGDVSGDDEGEGNDGAGKADTPYVNLGNQGMPESPCTKAGKEAPQQEAAQPKGV